MREGEGREGDRLGRGACEGTSEGERVGIYPGILALQGYLTLRNVQCSAQTVASATRNCWLSGAVTSAGFECLKPAPKQTSLGWYRKETLRFSKGREK